MKKPVGKLEVKVTNLSKVGIQITVKEIEQLINDYAKNKLLYGCIEAKVVND